MSQHPQQQEGALSWFMTGSHEEIANILAEFAQELRDGDIKVWRGQRELHLDPEGKLELRVEAIVEQDRQGFHIRLDWDRPSAAG